MIFKDLSTMQAAGLACVLCNVPYDIPPDVDRVPVGHAPDGRKVYACETDCAPALGYVPPAEQLALEVDR